MSDNLISVLCYSETSPGWEWIKGLKENEDRYNWTFISSQRRGLIENNFPFFHLGRVRAGLEIRQNLKKKAADYLVTHGAMTSYFSAMLGNLTPETKHLVMSFNFTEIPSGQKYKMLKKAFEKIDRFAVCSKIEIDLYSKIFEIPVEKIDFVRWGISSPITVATENSIKSPYFVAMGGEARDYATLCETARIMPDTKFVFIVRPDTLIGMSIPDNVSVYVNIPWQNAWSLVWHAEAALIPLRDNTTANGHITIVGGMHVGQCHIVTDSTGIHDYAEHEKTALLVPQKDPVAFKRAIERLKDDIPLRDSLRANAQKFAQKYCSEGVASRYFREFTGA